MNTQGYSFKKAIEFTEISWDSNQEKVCMIQRH